MLGFEYPRPVRTDAIDLHDNIRVATCDRRQRVNAQIWKSLKVDTETRPNEGPSHGQAVQAPENQAS